MFLITCVMYVVQDRHAEADPLYQRSQAIREKALGPDHLDVSHVLNDRALSLYQQARLSTDERPHGLLAG